MKDRRYGTARWQRVRAHVLRRDLHVCRVVDGCTTPATVADHVMPSSPGMSDAQFFDPGNLRASCHRHNIARGFAATLDAPAVTGAVVTRDYSR